MFASFCHQGQRVFASRNQPDERPRAAGTGDLSGHMGAGADDTNERRCWLWHECVFGEVKKAMRQQR